MRVLVTGGAGFIGSHLVDGLLELGHTVAVFDNLEPQVHPTGEWPSYLNSEARRVRGDVRDVDALNNVLDGIDAVYHFAAMVGVGQSMYEIRRYCDVNVMGTATVLEALLPRRDQVSKLVVASSMSLYGEGRYRDAEGNPIAPGLRPDSQLERHDWEVYGPDGQPAVPVPTDEEKIARPTSVYAVSKRDQEELCLSVGRAYGIPAVALRFFNVFGSRQALSNPYTGVAAIFSSRMLSGNPPVVYEDGNQTRDFVHVSDIVQANLLALQHSRADYEAINVGTGRPVTINEVATTLAKALGKPIVPEITGQFRAGDIRHCVADIRKAESLLGYAPKIGFEAGMDALVEWVARQAADDRFETARGALEAHRLIR